MRILITGSSGLVGQGLAERWRADGHEVVGYDLRGEGEEQGDVRDAAGLARAAEGCHGIVHLAAVSRVVWGENDPQACIDTNVGGVRNAIDAAERQQSSPWLLFSSSREVYGEPAELPVPESAPLVPLNVYGRTKVEGENLVLGARTRGLVTGVVRLSNVYGRTHDHADRVIPAFARGAAAGETLRIDGSGHTFDFTHLDDTVRGIDALVRRLAAGDPPPPIHLLTGVATTLGELAATCIRIAGGQGSVREAPERSYDVARFVGDPSLAGRELDWRARTPLEDGLAQLIADYRAM